MNRALQYIQDSGETLEKWFGQCSVIAEDIQTVNDDMVWVEGDVDRDYPWWYHQVIRDADGLIHDAWCDAPEPLPLDKWLIHMFGEFADVTVTINGKDVFSGQTQEFSFINHLTPTVDNASISL